MLLNLLLKDADLCAPLSQALACTDAADLTADSRAVREGILFFCLKGTRSDGHDFAAQALQQGAAAVVCERDLGLEKQIVVRSTRYAFAMACAAYFGHPSQQLKMVAVTGTNGKTTTTYLLKQMLECAGHKVGLIGTIQNMIGDTVLESGYSTPEPYSFQKLLRQMADADCRYVVMETSSHALDQDRVAGCTFEVGIFTNLTQDHLDYHGTMENYLLAKKRLFAISRIAVINADDPYAAQMRQGLDIPVLTFSAQDDAADYVARNIKGRPDGVDFELLGTGVIGRVRLCTPGRFSVYNAMGAAVCALALGLPFQTVIEALPQVRGVKGRAEVVPCDKPFTVVIDYAHTPDGIVNICRTMRECCSGRLITLFGCGGDRDKTKRPKMAAAAAELSDHLIVTSDNPRTEDPAAIIADILPGLEGKNTPYTVIEDRVQAIRWGLENAREGDILLLAGKGHETYQIIGTQKFDLDERVVIEQALKG